MEGITAYLLPGSIIVFVLHTLSGLHLNHLFVWMDAEVVAHDEIIQNNKAISTWLFFSHVPCSILLDGTFIVSILENFHWRKTMIMDWLSQRILDLRQASWCFTSSQSQ